ncbi:MAG: tetratricopeptide repeat protein [Phycisphaerales bacterium JB059]
MPQSTRRVSSYRSRLSTVGAFTLLTVGLASPASGQANPLEKGSENPLDRLAEREPYHGPQVLDLPMRLEGEGLTVELNEFDVGASRLSGRVRMGGTAYPLTGVYENPTRLVGAFQAGGKSYDCTLEGEPERGYVFATGQSTYTLRNASGVTRRTDPAPPTGRGADPATLQRASDAMAAQDFETALRLARPLAEQGHVGANYLVAMCSAFGLGTTQDLGVAKRSFETAARGDHPSALFELGAMAHEGAFGERNDQAAIGYFERSAKLGSLGGIMSYGEMLLNGLGREADFVEGIAWVGVAAKRGHADAKELIEYFNSDKNVAPADRQRALARTAELERTLPDAGKLDDLVGYNRFVTPAPQSNPKKPLEVAPAVDLFAGGWSGVVSEEMDFGQVVQCPLTLNVTRDARGSYNADLVLEARMPTADGRTIDIKATGRFVGEAPGGRGALRATDTTMTILQTGETVPLGAQQLEIQVQGNALTGRLGNDVEGWSPVQATRPGPRGGEPGGTGPGASDARGGSSWTPGASTEFGRPEERGGVNASASVTLEPVTLSDPEMGGAPSHTLLVPSGWQREGGVRWNQPQLYLDMVHLDLTVSAPDGVCFGYHPGAQYTWSDIFQINAAMGVPGSGPPPQPGQITGEGLRFMPLPQTTGDYVLNMLIPQRRPHATGVQVIEAQEMPEVLATMREMLAPTFRSMEEQNRMMRQMGGGEMQMPIFADRVRVTYTENGRRFEEDVFITGYAVITRTPLANGQMVTSARWGIDDIRTVRGPVGGSPNRAIADAASLSVRPDPKWLATIMQLRAQINKTVNDGIIERGRITREGMQKSFELHQESVRSRQASNDKMHHQFINYIRDVEDYQTPGGQVVQLPSTYNNAYMNGQGQVVMTNSVMTNTNGWTKLNRATR